MTEDGRAFRYDLSDIEEVEREIRTWDGERYIFIHPDGYQEERIL